jgi:hypothetical protein
LAFIQNKKPTGITEKKKKKKKEKRRKRLTKVYIFSAFCICLPLKQRKISYALKINLHKLLFESIDNTLKMISNIFERNRLVSHAKVN